MLGAAYRESRHCRWEEDSGEQLAKVDDALPEQDGYEVGEEGCMYFVVPTELAYLLWVPGRFWAGVGRAVAGAIIWRRAGDRWAVVCVCVHLFVTRLG